MNRNSAIIRLVALLASVLILIPVAIASAPVSTASVHDNQVSMTETYLESGGIIVEEGESQYVNEIDDMFDDNPTYRIEAEDDPGGNVTGKTDGQGVTFLVIVPEGVLFCVYVEKSGGGNVNMDLTITYLDDPSTEHTVSNAQNETFYSITNPGGGPMSSYTALENVVFASAGNGIKIEVNAKRAGNPDKTDLRLYVVYDTDVDP